MKRLAALLLIIGVCAIALVPSHTQAQRPEVSQGKLRRNAAAIKNQYIVVFNESVRREQVGEEAARLVRLHGGTIGFTYRNALRGFSVEMNEAAAEALSRHPKVEFIEEDAEVQGASTQTNAPWQLDRLDQRTPAPSNTYTYEANGAGVNAYIIDGGIRYTHQEFGGRAAFAYDYIAGGTGADCNGHGTHVAALLGGNTYGVAKGVKLWSVRVLDCANGGTLARIISGVDWVAGNHVKPAVANLSFITIVSTSVNGTMDIAVKNLIAAGVTTVVAAGNNTGDASLRTPARVPEAITVGATDQNDNRSPNSNFGASVDVFAPGVDIVSAHVTGDAATSIRSGTSSAAPIVGGLAARYLSTRPGDAPDAVGQAIRNSATPGQVINPGEGSQNLLAYTGITLSDNFNDNVRDARWGVLATPGSNIAEQNGRLEVTPTAAMPGYDGYKSVTAIDLTDTSMSVEAVSVPTTNGFATFYGLADGSGNYLLLGVVSSGTFLMQQSVGGVVTNSQLPYNATQQRFWRFRHNRSDDTVNWETSPDGATWTIHRSIATPFPVTNLQVVLTGQKATATSPSDTVIFDNLWQEPNPTTYVAMADNFNDNAIHPQMWVVNDPASPTVVSEQNGQLEVTPQPNTSGYNGLEMAGPFDFRDKTLQVEVQPASQAGAVWTYFKLYIDDSNGLVFAVGANLFTCDSTINGVTDRTQLAWDATIRYWRFRHDIDANTVSFDTSADGVTWTTRKTVTPAFSLGAVRTGFGAGATGTTNAAPGTAIFDNFRVERYRPLFPLSDNFNDNVRAAKWNTLATSGSNIVEQNGRLEITPAAAMPGYDGYVSATTIDLTDARVAVQTVAVPTTNGFATFYALRATSGNYLMLGVSTSGTLITQRSVGGVVTQTSVPYNATQQRFWRFRHNRAADTVSWETSPDGATWTTQAAYPTPFDITGLQVLLVGQKATASAPNDTVVFDNLRIERNEGGKAR
ncbi:MAG TPA: S8 family peptidase [Pyrinomonadaceae bacterium]